MAAGGHLEKNGCDVITPPTIVWLLRNLASRCKMTSRYRHIRHNRNRK